MNACISENRTVKNGAGPWRCYRPRRAPWARRSPGRESEFTRQQNGDMYGGRSTLSDSEGRIRVAGSRVPHPRAPCNGGSTPPPRLNQDAKKFYVQAIVA